MRYDDWGVRSPQWAGLRSVSTSVCGVPVHHVRAEPSAGAPPGAPVHLLVPPMTGSASMWIDLVPHLRQLGPVVSVDLQVLHWLADSRAHHPRGQPTQGR